MILDYHADYSNSGKNGVVYAHPLVSSIRSHLSLRS